VGEPQAVGDEQRKQAATSAAVYGGDDDLGLITGPQEDAQQRVSTDDRSGEARRRSGSESGTRARGRARPPRPSVVRPACWLQQRLRRYGWRPIDFDSPLGLERSLALGPRRAWSYRVPQVGGAACARQLEHDLRARVLHMVKPFPAIRLD